MVTERGKAEGRSVAGLPRGMQEAGNIEGRRSTVQDDDPVPEDGDRLAASATGVLFLG